MPTLLACPSCRAPLASGATPCQQCGFALSAGLVRRGAPQQTRGLDAVGKKFGARWSFALAALSLLMIAVYYDDMTTAEKTGGSFTADWLTALVYKAAGKWAACSVWLLVGVLLLLAGLRARRVARGEERSLR